MPTCNPRTCPMRERIKLLEAIILDGAPVPDPSMERAVEASLRGDWGPLMRINERSKERHGGVSEPGSRKRNSVSRVMSPDVKQQSHIGNRRGDFNSPVIPDRRPRVQTVDRMNPNHPFDTRSDGEVSDSIKGRERRSRVGNPAHADISKGGMTVMR